MTYKQKVELVQALASLPALSVIVFIRRRIGFRLLDSGWYVIVAIIVYLIAWFNLNPQARYPYAMEWYALGIVVFGAFHRAVAWFQFQKGNQPHSYSSGISIFETSRTPRFFRRYRLANRLVDPFVAAVVGLLVKVDVSDVFGTWLLFSGASLFLWELFIQGRAVGRDLDTADGLMEAGMQSDTVKHFERKGKAADVGSDGGPVISTGLSSDIAGRVRRRKASQ